MKRYRERSRGAVLVLLAAAIPKVALAELQQVTFRRHSTSGSSSYSGRMSGGGGEQQQDVTVTRRSRGVGGERHGGSALASVFRLTRKIVEQPSSQQPSSTFLARLQDRLHVISHGSRKSDNGSGSGRRLTHRNNAIANTATSSAGASAFLNRIARALKDGLAQSGAGVRRGSTIAVIILGVACILSVAAANTIVSHPAGWIGWGAKNTNSNSTMAAVAAPLDGGVEGDAGRSRLMSSLKGLGRRGQAGGSGRLLAKAPRFPLAYVPWWKAVQDRRKVSTCYYR